MVPNLITEGLPKNGTDATAGAGRSYGFRRFLELAVGASGFDMSRVREFACCHTAEKPGDEPGFSLFQRRRLRLARIARIFAPDRFRKIFREAASSLTAARGEPDSSAGRHVTLPTGGS
jgi:hypothetical protein